MSCLLWRCQGNPDKASHGGLGPSPGSRDSSRLSSSSPRHRIVPKIFRGSHDGGQSRARWPQALLRWDKEAKRSTCRQPRPNICRRHTGRGRVPATVALTPAEPLKLFYSEPIRFNHLYASASKPVASPSRAAGEGLRTRGRTDPLQKLGQSSPSPACLAGLGGGGVSVWTLTRTPSSSINNCWSTTAVKVWLAKVHTHARARTHARTHRSMTEIGIKSLFWGASSQNSDLGGNT